MIHLNKTKLVNGGLVFVTTLAAFLLTIPVAKADDSFVDEVTIDVPLSCSMTADVSSAHEVEMDNGSTISDIGTTNLKIICNDGSGYALYAIGYTDDEYGKTTLSSPALGSTHDIITSSTIEADTSSWAMKLNTSGSTFVPIIAGSSLDGNKESGDPDFSDYTAVPDEYTKVAYYSASTDSGENASGSNLTTTYRAHISRVQPAGTYVGQVKYTLVHPSTASKPVLPLKESDCPAGYICYAPNASDIVGSMSSLDSITSSPTAGKISVGTSATEINLIAPNYKREGYGFAGWSTSFDATSATNSVIYGPNETVSTNPQDARGLDVSSGAILYPVWIAKEKNVTMQTFNSTNYPAYNSAPNGTVIALEDERDHDVYAVAKLADGNWWMIENLRLDNNANITTSNTQSNNGSFGGVFTGLPASEDANFINNTVANSLYSTTNITGNYQAYRFPRYNNNNTNAAAMGGTGVNSSNTSLSDSYNTDSNAVSWYSYGNYYSWAAAMASTNEYTNYNGTGTAGSDSAGTSICPTGWRLPSGVQRTTTNKSFSKLDYILGGTGGDQNTAVASNRWRAYPNNFIYSGYFNGLSTSYRGSYGFYWSSSADNSLYAYNLYFASNYVSPGASYGVKNSGFSVRCISE